MSVRNSHKQDRQKIQIRKCSKQNKLVKTDHKHLIGLSPLAALLTDYMRYISRIFRAALLAHHHCGVRSLGDALIEFILYDLQSVKGS